MALYVNPTGSGLPHPPLGRQGLWLRSRVRWCSLVSDGDEAELHTAAAALGLPRSYFHPTPFPHYDLAGNLYGRARALGAVVVGDAELPARCRRAA
jgi:Protein of unknown function (DUF4031)